MRVCIRIEDQRILEAQSNDDAPLDALFSNALAAGFMLSEVLIQVVPDADFAEMAMSQNRNLVQASPTLADVISVLSPDQQAQIAAKAAASVANPLDMQAAAA